VSSINDGRTSTSSVPQRDHRKQKITNINKALKGRNTEKTNNMGQSLVKNYITNQKEHHSKKTFQDEYKVFLKKYDVAYDERYVWD
jgi:hypothetical protein